MPDPKAPKRGRSPRAPKVSTPPPSGHTEELRIVLREQRRRLGLDPADVEHEVERAIARRLAMRLTEERADRGIEQLDIARQLAAEAGEDPSEVRKGTRVSNWELMIREPRIDEFAAWARAVGMRLVVLLEPVDSPRKAVMVAPELAEVAAAAGQLSPAKAAAATAIIERLMQMSPGEVKALALGMKAQYPDE